MVMDKGKDDSNEPKPWRENEAWRKRPITEKQAMLLHDLSCEMFASLKRGEASDLIHQMLSNSDPQFNKRDSFDEDTLEENK
tara:strand:- start:102 stop:347 length:246 start_codon:yes stop_codon:yes gene_type:complete